MPYMVTFGFKNYSLYNYGTRTISIVHYQTHFYEEVVLFPEQLLSVSFRCSP